MQIIFLVENMILRFGAFAVHLLSQMYSREQQRYYYEISLML
jgi:hypothetical protein